VIEHIYAPLDDEDYSAQGDDDFVVKFMTSNTKEPVQEADDLAQIVKEMRLRKRAVITAPELLN